MLDLLKYLPVLTPSILIAAGVLGWTSRGKVQFFMENLVDNHVHTVVGELGKGIQDQIANQTTHLTNKLDEQTNKLVAAIQNQPRQ
jgi:hypothetical protein